MMSYRLEVDLSTLRAAVDVMGARDIDVGDIVGGEEGGWEGPVWEDIDDELMGGIDIELESVEHSNRVLEFKGRQVVLFIPDHGWRVRDALENGERGKRIHVAWCRTLEDMKARGRYERYVVTTSIGPRFPISGRDEIEASIEGEAELKVCMNCLKCLRYRGYTGGRGPIWRSFRLEEFYETYRTFFPEMPTRWAGAPEGYSDDWSRVSRNYRALRSWTCEECSVKLGDATDLLDVHHRDGVKSNNAESNLKVVCRLCHAREPSHGHMGAPPRAYKRIQKRRRAQGLLEDLSWGEVARLVDPGVTGAVDRLAEERAVPAELGVRVKDGDGRVVAEPELAWPKQKFGVAIAESDREGMKRAEWTAVKVHRLTAPDESVPAELKRAPRARSPASRPPWPDHNLPW